MASVTAEERERIVQALRSGLSQNAVAKRFGRGPATINRIAQAEGLEYSERPENAAAARRDYAQAERVALLNEAFAKARELLPGCSTPGQLWQWSTATAVLITNRRLEDGEATSRAEVNDSRDDARSRLASRLDELASRRAAKAVVERAVG